MFQIQSIERFIKKHNCWTGSNFTHFIKWVIVLQNEERVTSHAQCHWYSPLDIHSLNCIEVLFKFCSNSHVLRFYQNASRNVLCNHFWGNHWKFLCIAANIRNKTKGFFCFERSTNFTIFPLSLTALEKNCSTFVARHWYWVMYSNRKKEHLHHYPLFTCYNLHLHLHLVIWSYRCRRSYVCGRDKAEHLISHYTTCINYRRLCVFVCICVIEL